MIFNDQSAPHQHGRHTGGPVPVPRGHGTLYDGLNQGRIDDVPGSGRRPHLLGCPRPGSGEVFARFARRPLCLPAHRNSPSPVLGVRQGHETPAGPRHTHPARPRKRTLRIKTQAKPFRLLSARRRTPAARPRSSPSRARDAAADGESAAGVSPAAALRTVRDTLASHGSRCRTRRASTMPPMHEHARIDRSDLGESLPSLAWRPVQVLELPHRPLHQMWVDAIT